MKLSQRQGIILAFGAAIVSGISSYINKFVVVHVTILLSASFDGKVATAPQIAAMALLVLDAALFAFPPRLRRHPAVEAL